jgi:hypothetical protein
LAKISDAVDRTNTLIGSLLDRAMYPQPGVTTPSPTRQDPDQLLRSTGRFRAPVRPAISTPVEKKEKRKMLNMRVSELHIEIDIIAPTSVAEGNSRACKHNDEKDPI